MCGGSAVDIQGIARRYTQGENALEKRDMIVQKLKESGCKITRQRLMLLDIILEDECSCCKEIYYKAVRKDEKIGMATVYRMINTLEEIGVISRKNMYRVVCGEECCKQEKRK